MSNTTMMTISEAIDRLDKICPYLKPTSYVPFGSLYIFQVAQKDGTPIIFDNLMAIDRMNGVPFPFNPLKFGKKYAMVASKFIAINT